MTTNESDQARRNRLRRLAEQQVKSSARSAQAIPKEEVLQLIHELEVHQVELEMQNEELRQSESELEESRQKYFRPLRPGFGRLRDPTARKAAESWRHQLIEITEDAVIAIDRKSRIARFSIPLRRRCFDTAPRKLSGKK
ncbi:MAG: hypothetical protein ACM3TN_10470 [Alphaproteobacteria bacterium]